MTTAFILFNIATARVHAVLWRRDQVQRWRRTPTMLISEIAISHIDRIADDKLSLQTLPVSVIFEGMTRYANH